MRFAGFFPVLLGLALGLPGCGSESATGSLEIRALASPTCPVETLPPDPACAPQPIAVRVVVLDENERRVATITTRVDGTVSLSLRPGRYRLVGEDPGPPSVEGQDVVVDTAPIAVTIGVDTGIR